MKPYTIHTVARIIGGTISGKDNGDVVHLSIDSRSMNPPEGTLFFALKGERYDGHNFIPDLLDKGVCYFVVSEWPEKQPENTVFIWVRDTLEALQQLTAYHRHTFSSPVVGITGSNGKTIVKEWAFQVFSPEYSIIRSPRSYNSQVGVPLSVWEMQPQFDLALIEAGISRRGEMQRLETIIRPEIGIFTNIGEAHQENFTDKIEKAREKMALFAHSRMLIYCRDYPEIEEALAQTSFDQLTCFTWSFHQQADLQVTHQQVEQDKTHLTVAYHNRTFSLEIPFTDQASMENALHVSCLMLYYGYSFTTIRQRLRLLAPVAMRLEMKKGIHNCTVINDSYNSDMGSLTIALDFLAQQNQHPQKTLILSDILQTGKHPAQLYREVASLIHHKQIDRLIGIGPYISAWKHLFRMDSMFFASTEDFLDHLPRVRFYNEAILLKGGRKFAFERISRLLEQKMNRTVLEINLNALQHNLNYFRSLLQDTTGIMVMVKAFSYGSGSYEIAHMLEYQHVDYLGVAFVDEGIELRNAGVSVPIMVMNPENASYHMMIQHQLEPEIFDINGLRLFHEQLYKMGEPEPYPVHIKLDTGMNRLGFYSDEIDDLIAELKRLPAIKVRSVFSHLAASDEPQHDAFTRLQIERFESMSNQLIRGIGYPVKRHILNSGGIERFPGAQYDMVRLGIGIYGVSAVNSSKVRNISTLKSYIAQIKEVPSTETVGYGRQGKLTRDSTIGVVPIGYADGVNRLLGNGEGQVIVNNQFVPTVGNICMDLTMIDLTGVEAAVEDEVIVFGEQQPITVLAQQLHTIPYEVLTSVSSRVKRIYYHE